MSARLRASNSRRAASASPRRSFGTALSSLTIRAEGLSTAARAIAPASARPNAAVPSGFSRWGENRRM